MNQTFPKYFKLRNKKDFDKSVPRKRLENKFFIVFKTPNNLNHWRLGIPVGRKFGNAVERNNIKRRIREFFRKNIDKRVSFDFIVIPKYYVEIPKSDINFFFLLKN